MTPKNEKQRSLNKKRYDIVLRRREEEIKPASRILSLSKVALVIVGDIAVAGVESFFPHPYYHTFCRHREHSFQTTVSRLKKRGFIEKDKGGRFFLTKLGAKERDNVLQRIGLEKSKDEKWDGKWRLLIFDVPETHKKLREFLRAELISYGFLPMQKSAWISPHRVSEKLKGFIEDHNMEEWVELLVIEILSDEKVWRKKFGV